MKEAMGTPLKSSENSGLIRKNSFPYLSGILGMAYNPLINEDIRNWYFGYEQVLLLRFCYREYQR